MAAEIRIEQERVVVGDQEIRPPFVAPDIERIAAAGIMPGFMTPLLIGTSACCHGRLYTYVAGMEQHLLRNILSVDLNIYDIRPAIPKGELIRTGEAAIVAGYGCSGRGVRVMGLETPKNFEIMGDDEFARLMGIQYVQPRIAIDPKSGKVQLELYRQRWVARQGRRRDQNLPGILVNAADEMLVTAEEPFRRVDITDRLHEVIDLDRTFALQGRYHQARW